MRRSSRSLHLLRAASLAGIIGASVVTPVAAKMPYFSIEVSPAAPVADEPIRIVVRTWVDVAHTSPAGFEAPGVMEGILVIRDARMGGADVPEIPEIAVSLRSQAPDLYAGTVTLPAGDWRIVAFPDRAGWGLASVPVGYPDEIALTVRPAGPRPLGFPGPLVGVGAVLAAGSLRLAPDLASRLSR